MIEFLYNLEMGKTFLKYDSESEPTTKKKSDKFYFIKASCILYWKQCHKKVRIDDKLGNICNLHDKGLIAFIYRALAA